MLLATQYGLYCILQPRLDVYQVHAGSRGELEDLLSLTDVEAEIEVMDRPARSFRVEVELEDVLEMVVQLSTRMHYADFGERIAASEGQRKWLGAYEPLLGGLGLSKPAAAGL